MSPNSAVEGIGPTIEMAPENCPTYALESSCTGVYVETESNIATRYGAEKSLGV